MWNHMQSYGIICNHMESYAIIWNHMKSHGIILNSLNDKLECRCNSCRKRIPEASFPGKFYTTESFYVVQSKVQVVFRYFQQISKHIPQHSSLKGQGLNYNKFQQVFSDR